MRIYCPQKASKEKMRLGYEGFTPHTVEKSAPLSAKSYSRQYALPGGGWIWYIKPLCNVKLLTYVHHNSSDLKSLAFSCAIIIFTVSSISMCSI
jgi:hypothetical protein